MPLVDSFLVDHTIIKAPSVRLAKQMVTPKGDDIQVWDLRFKRPNKEVMPEKGIHTFEHYLAGFMRDNLNKEGEIEIIDISPMGCKTGFYMSVIGRPTGDAVAKALKASAEQIAKLPDDAKIPAANEYQCGFCKFHSIKEAKEIASGVVGHEVVVIKNEDIALDPEKLKALESE